MIPDDDGVRIEADQSGWSIVIDGDRFEWQDGDVAAFAGEIVGPPVGWKVDDFVYVHAVAVVSGEVLGRRVDGFVGLDQAHLPAGRTFYVDDPVAQGRWMVGMLSFGNRYRDGSIEVGAVGFGHDGWRYAFVNTPDGTRTMTNDVDGRVLREDGYWPTEVEIEIDGERWVWECPRSGRFTGYGRLENPQSDGRFRRVGDDREIVSWFAQGETVPAHGDRPER